MPWLIYLFLNILNLLIVLGLIWTKKSEIGYVYFSAVPSDVKKTGNSSKGSGEQNLHVKLFTFHRYTAMKTTTKWSCLSKRNNENYYHHDQ